MENPQEVLRECLDKFSTPDYIMEPGIFTQLKRFVEVNHVHAKSLFFFFVEEIQNEPIKMSCLLFSSDCEAVRDLVV